MGLAGWNLKRRKDACFGDSTEPGTVAKRPDMETRNPSRSYKRAVSRTKKKTQHTTTRHLLSDFNRSFADLNPDPIIWITSNTKMENPSQ
jgi:hypothetical protein